MRQTHLAVALAIRAVEAGWRGYFTTAEDMTTNLVAASIDGTWTNKLRTYTAPTVLVIDDVGLLPMSNRNAASAFFQVVTAATRKATRRSSAPTASLPDWGEIFGDSVVAAAILDRLMHNAVVFNIRGPSWRLREHHGLEIATTQPR
jgi:DNA replication protein DnaC